MSIDSTRLGYTALILAPAFFAAVNAFTTGLGIFDLSLWFNLGAGLAAGYAIFSVVRGVMERDTIVNDPEARKEVEGSLNPTQFWDRFWSLQERGEKSLKARLPAIVTSFLLYALFTGLGAHFMPSEIPSPS